MNSSIVILGQSVSLFYLFWLIASVAGFALGYAIRKRYGFSFAKCTTYMAGGLTFGLLYIFGISWVCTGGKISELNYIRIVPFMWSYFALLAWYLKDPYGKVFDFLTIASAFLFVVARIGCIFAGCCHGYPSQWGLYSRVAGTVCFPVQIIEMIVGLLVVFLLLHLSKKLACQGKIYPYYLITFGTTRFALEFLRDNVKLFWGLSELALFAAACVILGIGILLYQKKKGA